MKVLLINPSNVFNGYHVPKLLGRLPFMKKHLNFEATSLFPPLNLALLAAYTPSDVDVKIMDGCVEPIDDTVEADLVGVTSLTGNATVAYQIADRFRARGSTVVMGGNHPTVLPEEALQHCDAVTVGEADETWPELIADFRRGRLKRLYRPARLPTMAQHPLPRWDLLRREKYLVPYTIQTSRGCPFDCNFCSVTAINGQKFRVRPIEDVVAEIQASGARKLFFVDDIINGHPKHARELMEALIPLKIKWGSQATINIAEDREMLRLAQAGGCTFLFIGLESFLSPEFRKLGGCNAAPEKMLAAIRRIRDHGIAIWGSFIVGLETDTVATIQKTVELAIEAQLEFAQFSIMTPLPGTRLRQELLAQNRIFNHDWVNYTYGNLVFEPAHMTREQVKQAYHEAWKAFYRLRSIYRRLGGWPFDKRRRLLWVINLGICRALSYGLNNASNHQVPRAEEIVAASIGDQVLE
jgi:radical SAM superfamily enzyme YgiQ (UPF0313 family)